MLLLYNKTVYWECNLHFKQKSNAKQGLIKIHLGPAFENTTDMDTVAQSNQQGIMVWTEKVIDN